MSITNQVYGAHDMAISRLGGFVGKDLYCGLQPSLMLCQPSLVLLPSSDVIQPSPLQHRAGVAWDHTVSLKEGLRLPVCCSILGSSLT
jgi:hypothetical protein